MATSRQKPKAATKATRNPLRTSLRLRTALKKIAEEADARRNGVRAWGITRDYDGYEVFIRVRYVA
jgi:hypothetical protein